jgi:hypothetical protein
MARIRSVHPGLASDEAYMTMSMAAKAAWPLLWTECDDHGIFEWKPIVLKARIFPADAVDFAAILEEYETLGCVKRIEIEGKACGLIRNFGKYQRPKSPSYRYQWSNDFASFAGFSAALPQPSPSPTEKSPQRKEEGGKREEELKKETANAVSLAPAPAKAVFEIECRNLVGEEPVLLALDFHKLQALVESGAVTEADVKAGISAAMAKPDFRIRHWSQLEGWARGAAKERMEGKSKQVTNGYKSPVAADKRVWLPQGSVGYEAWRKAFPGTVKGILTSKGSEQGILMPTEYPPSSDQSAAA